MIQISVKNSDLETYRAVLLGKKAEPSSVNAAILESRDTVTFDQQSIRRLSRMEALQRQAMAQAIRLRDDNSILWIDVAPKCTEIGEFGYCQDCGDVIGKKRLDLDPTVPVCLTCAKG